MGMEAETRDVQVTVGLEPYTYSRLALLAHRRNHALGDEIRAALHAYVDAQLAEGKERLDQAQRTITRERSTDST